MTTPGKNLISGIHLASGGSRRKKGGSRLAVFAFFLAILGAAGGGYLLQRSGVLTRESTGDTPAHSVTQPSAHIDDLLAPPTQTPGTVPPPPPPPPPPQTGNRESAGATPPPPPAPTDPAMERAMQNLQGADRMIQERRFDEAKGLLADFLKEDYPPAAKAAAYYRLGLIGRHTQDEAFAQENWKKAYENHPEHRWGRMSAMALADTWYAWYAGATPRKDKWEEIRDAYSTVLGMDGARFLDKATIDRIAERLDQLNEYLVFDPKAEVAGAVFHTVRPGENMSGIARRYHLDTWTSIAQINRIQPRSIREGMRLKIMTGRLTCVVDRRDLTLTWYLDGRWIRRYPVCIGPGLKTAPGTYRIVSMDVEPVWTHPDTGRQIPFGHPEHAIGTRWMAMEGMGTRGLGIHGTNEPESVPGRTSNGCVRLLNEHVEELFGFASIQPGNETDVYILPE